jgi:hypothetical protein
MNQRRSRASFLLAIPVLLAALTLTSCSTPSTGFHFVGVTPVTSKAIAGEQQLFPGSYTLAANDTSNVSDLHWAITYGDSLNPSANPVKTADGVASVTATFAAPPDATKRFYRVCLSSIAQPLLQTCLNVAVGGNAIWAGNWSSPPAGFITTQSGANVSLQLYFMSHPSARFEGPLASPFLFTQSIQGVDGWFEWISNNELKAFFPPIIGTTAPVSFTRNQT